MALSAEPSNGLGQRFLDGGLGSNEALSNGVVHGACEVRHHGFLIGEGETQRQDPLEHVCAPRDDRRRQLDGGKELRQGTTGQSAQDREELVPWHYVTRQEEMRRRLHPRSKHGDMGPGTPMNVDEAHRGPPDQERVAVAEEAGQRVPLFARPRIGRAEDGARVRNTDGRTPPPDFAGHLFRQPFGGGIAVGEVPRGGFWTVPPSTAFLMGKTGSPSGVGPKLGKGAQLTHDRPDSQCLRSNETRAYSSSSSFFEFVFVASRTSSTASLMASPAFLAACSN